MTEARRPPLARELEPLHLIDCSPLLAERAGASAELPSFTVTSTSGDAQLTARAQFRVDRTNRGVRIVGSIAGLQEGACARCLEPARAEIAIQLDEEVLEHRFATAEAERFGRGNAVDAGRLAIEALDLNRQLALRCDPPCPERCQRCGAAHALLDCPQHERDPRLAALGRLLPRSDRSAEP